MNTPLETELIQKLAASEAANAQMREALESDALWGLSGTSCPTELECRYENGGSLTSGPNNCQKAFQKIHAALSTPAGTGWLSPEVAQKLRGEVGKTYSEGHKDGRCGGTAQAEAQDYANSRAKRIAEGKDV